MYIYICINNTLLVGTIITIVIPVLNLLLNHYHN